MNGKKTTTDAVKILHEEFVKGDPEMERLVEEERVKLTVGLEVHRLRTDRGLSHAELAELTGIAAETIEDLEEADLEGDSLVLLGRIANALGKEVHIVISDKTSIVPREGEPHA